MTEQEAISIAELREHVERLFSHAIEAIQKVDKKVEQLSNVEVEDKVRVYERMEEVRNRISALENVTRNLPERNL